MCVSVKVVSQFFLLFFPDQQRQSFWVAQTSTFLYFVPAKANFAFHPRKRRQSISRPRWRVPATRSGWWRMPSSSTKTLGTFRHTCKPVSPTFCSIYIHVSFIAVHPEQQLPQLQLYWLLVGPLHFWHPLDWPQLGPPPPRARPSCRVPGAVPCPRLLSSCHPSTNLHRQVLTRCSSSSTLKTLNKPQKAPKIARKLLCMLLALCMSTLSSAAFFLS